MNHNTHLSGVTRRPHGTRVATGHLAGKPKAALYFAMAGCPIYYARGLRIARRIPLVIFLSQFLLVVLFVFVLVFISIFNTAPIAFVFYFGIWYFICSNILLLHKMLFSKHKVHLYI